MTSIRTASRTSCALLLATFSLSVVADGHSGNKVSALEANNCVPAASEDLRGDPANGKTLHIEHCAACHGADGKADVIVMHMDETPHDQSDAAYMDTLNDTFLYLAICKGGPGIGKSYVMSAWGDFFSHEEITDLIAWIRTFPENP